MQQTLVDLINSLHYISLSGIKAVLNFDLSESGHSTSNAGSSKADLSKYYELSKLVQILTNANTVSITMKLLNTGSLKHLVLQTNNSAPGFNKGNNPISFQLFGQCDDGSPLEEITAEWGTNSPADYGCERWYRIKGNKGFKYYLLVFKNKKGNPIEIYFQLKGKQQTMRVNQKTSAFLQ